MRFIKNIFVRANGDSFEIQNKVAINENLQSGAPFFSQELQKMLGVEEVWVTKALTEYASVPAAWRYLSQLKSQSNATDGLAKSLDVSEGFALWALVKALQPRVVVELGVNRGISARLWKEALKYYLPEHRLILCDLEDHRQAIGDEEAEFVLGDAYVTLKDIFDETQVDLLYNDAHPYSLIDWSVKEGLREQVPIFGFHDTGHKHARGPYKETSSSLSPSQKRENDENWAECGTWERHVIGEVFDPKALYQDAVENAAWKIQHFDSLFGVSIVMSKERLAHG